MCLNVLLCCKCYEEIDSEPNCNEDSETGIVCTCGQRDTYTDGEKCSECEELEA